MPTYKALPCLIDRARASAVSSSGVKTYIAGSKELVKTISNAFDGKWKGSSVKSVDRGWCVQVVSQDSDATIKPGTALMMKSNTGAKALGVVYVGKTDGKTPKEIDELRIKWINRLTGFNDYMKTIIISIIIFFTPSFFAFLIIFFLSIS